MLEGQSNHRKEWYDAIVEFNPDKSRLTKQGILKEFRRVEITFLGWEIYLTRAFLKNKNKKERKNKSYCLGFAKFF